MQAEVVRASWRVALAGVVLLVAARWSSERSHTRPQPAPATSSARADAPATHVHVKVRSLTARTELLAASARSPMTSSSPAVAMMVAGSVRSVALLLGGGPDDASDDRALWLRLTVDAADAVAIAAIASADPDVEQAFVEPEIALATRKNPMSASVSMDAHGTDRTEDDSCPITTPSFESYQGYLGPAPHGIDAPAAWRRGNRGAGVWFADIEGGWNAAHEDLPGDRIEHVAGVPINDRGWRQHGTAVLGEVVGRDNGKGVVGIAPDVERVFTASIGGIAVARAIDEAARRLRPGDVLLIELQGAGPRGHWLPVEYWDDVFDVIRAATSRGVVVIEAAGNGGEDLEHSAYRRKFDRKKRDSGAIMIGAGAPPRAGFEDREKLDFSNYGSRVDVQGWGRKVATLDYGDLQACDDGGDRHYTGEFSGTSSASPIVAGAAVILQSMARERGGPLSPLELRELLTATGTPQTGNTKKHIGPRPDLARAIKALDARGAR